MNQNGTEIVKTLAETKADFIEQLMNGDCNIASVWFSFQQLSGNVKLHDYSVEVQEQQMDYGDEAEFMEPDEFETYKEYTIKGKTDDPTYFNGFTFNTELVVKAKHFVDDGLDRYHLWFMSTENMGGEKKAERYHVMFAFGKSILMKLPAGVVLGMMEDGE